MFVKLVRDNRGRSYYKAIISDSKLTKNSPWTGNQKDELINAFKSTTDDYLTFKIRSGDEYLKRFDLPEKLVTDVIIRIYKKDVFKIIGDGNGNFRDVVQIFK